jgi:hypothetical protein
MATFMEANRVRLELKMKLSNYAWYHSSAVITESDGYGVIIVVERLDNQVRKLIPPVSNGVSVKTESK